MANKIIYATYDDDLVLLEGAKKLVANGIHINDVFSPFPIHGIDPVIGIKQTRLAICGFIYGLIGLIVALTGMYYFMIYDWPMNIGGKPIDYFYQNVPAFVPIAFEFTVLMAAHGMALTYFIRNWTLPGIKARNPYPYTTNDKFVMEIHPEDSDVSVEELTKHLNETGSVKVEER